MISPFRQTQEQTPTGKIRVGSELGKGCDLNHKVACSQQQWVDYWLMGQLSELCAGVTMGESGKLLIRNRLLPARLGERQP
jgi:hypothetical protein